MMYIEDAIEKFNELPVFVQNVFNNEKTINKIRYIESKYGLELAQILVYVAIGKMDNLAGYLAREFDLDERKSSVIAKEIDETVLNPLVDFINFLNPDPEKDLSVMQEKDYSVRFFKEDLTFFLKAPSDIRDAINKRIFFLLNDELNHKKSLENALYVNENNLTGKGIVMDGKPKEGTVGNWIKDFIKKNGTELFDNIVMAKYLADSENAKKISSSEKELVKKILVVYRNIKFFPDSMPSDDGKGWEIIPLEKEEELKVEKFKEKAKLPENEKLRELREMAEQFPVGSLERKAIEEEINKLK